jgi:hypothetical protein
MKINEVITEAGLLSKLGQGIKAGVAGYKQSRDVRKSTEQLELATDDALKNYNQFLASYTASGKQITPAVVAQWMSNYTRTKSKGQPVGVRPEQIRTWITQQLGDYFASNQLGAQTEQPAATKDQTQQQDPILTQVKLYGRSPLVYQFGGKNNLFTLNDKDQWVRYNPGSTKVPTPVDANTQQILNNAAKRDQIDLAKIQPTDTAQTVQTAKQTITKTDATKVASVTTPTGIRADKWSDGEWTTPDEEGKDGFVVDSDVPQLEKLLQQQSASKKPHTGGRRKGGLSQSPEAIRQRQARAAKSQPAVFTSNRRT